MTDRWKMWGYMVVSDLEDGTRSPALRRCYGLPDQAWAAMVRLAARYRANPHTTVTKEEGGYRVDVRGKSGKEWSFRLRAVAFALATAQLGE